MRKYYLVILLCMLFVCFAFVGCSSNISGTYKYYQTIVLKNSEIQQVKKVGEEGSLVADSYVLVLNKDNTATLTINLAEESAVTSKFNYIIDDSLLVLTERKDEEVKEPTKEENNEEQNEAEPVAHTEENEANPEAGNNSETEIDILEKEIYYYVNGDTITIVASQSETETTLIVLKKEKKNLLSVFKFKAKEDSAENEQPETETGSQENVTPNGENQQEIERQDPAVA